MHHHDHPEVVKRLRRAEGHLRTVIAMIEEGHPCLDLAQQMQAIENAIANAKKALIHDHITHCIEQSLKSPGPKRRAALKEFEAIAKYL
jgi:DNA-binding FrmR family transcriptional regulator